MGIFKIPTGKNFSHGIFKIPMGFLSLNSYLKPKTKYFWSKTYRNKCLRPIFMFSSGLKYLRRLERQVKFAKKNGVAK